MNEIEVGTIIYVENGHWYGLVIEDRGVKELLVGIEVITNKDNSKTISYPIVHKTVGQYSSLFDGSLDYKIIGNTRSALESFKQKEKLLESQLVAVRSMRESLIDTFEKYNIMVEKREFSKEEYIKRLVNELNKLDKDCKYKYLYSSKHDIWLVVSNTVAYRKEMDDLDYKGNVYHLEYTYVRDRKIENYNKFSDDRFFEITDYEYLELINNELTS